MDALAPISYGMENAAHETMDPRAILDATSASLVQPELVLQRVFQRSTTRILDASSLSRLRRCSTQSHQLVASDHRLSSLYGRADELYLLEASLSADLEVCQNLKLALEQIQQLSPATDALRNARLRSWQNEVQAVRGLRDRIAAREGVGDEKKLCSDFHQERIRMTDFLLKLLEPLEKVEGSVEVDVLAEMAVNIQRQLNEMIVAKTDAINEIHVRRQRLTTAMLDLLPAIDELMAHRKVTLDSLSKLIRQMRGHRVRVGASKAAGAGCTGVACALSTNPATFGAGLACGVAGFAMTSGTGLTDHLCKKKHARKCVKILERDAVIRERLEHELDVLRYMIAGRSLSCPALHTRYQQVCDSMATGGFVARGGTFLAAMSTAGSRLAVFPPLMAVGALFSAADAVANAMSGREAVRLAQEIEDVVRQSLVELVDLRLNVNEQLQVLGQEAATQRTAGAKLRRPRFWKTALT